MNTPWLESPNSQTRIHIRICRERDSIYYNIYQRGCTERQTRAVYTLIDFEQVRVMEYTVSETVRGLKSFTLNSFYAVPPRGSIPNHWLLYRYSDAAAYISTIYLIPIYIKIYIDSYEYYI